MPNQPPAPRPIEIWFDFASHYSYLSVMRIESAAAARAVPVAWRPVLLGPIFRELGWASSPFVVHPQKGEYSWIDVARRCARYELPLRRPSVFPRASLLPLRIAVAAADAPWLGDFCRATMTMNFVADREIDSAATMREVLAGLGVDADAMLARALSAPNKLALREQTEVARSRGIFGAPTFFVGTDMYWGDDRLDDALDACVTRSPT